MGEVRVSTRDMVVVEVEETMVNNLIQVIKADLAVATVTKTQ